MDLFILYSMYSIPLFLIKSLPILKFCNSWSKFRLTQINLCLLSASAYANLSDRDFAGIGWAMWIAVNQWLILRLWLRIYVNPREFKNLVQLSWAFRVLVESAKYALVGCAENALDVQKLQWLSVQKMHCVCRICSGLVCRVCTGWS